MFRKAVIIGVGQIGASVGMNLIAKRLAKEVVGVGRDPKNLRLALHRRAVHTVVGARRALPLLANLSRNDLVILATPVRTISALLKKMPKGPLILDVGSTKSAIVSEARRRGLRFIGCHPIAGTEVPGAAGADKNLFRGKICILTPAKGTSSKDLALVRRLWSRLGSAVLTMDPKTHDRTLAAFSHLPHVLAYALVSQAPTPRVPKGLFNGLGGFRSATRVAASSPEMWRDILLENREPVLSALSGYEKELKRLRRLIARREDATLFRYLAKAQKKRRELP